MNVRSFVDTVLAALVAVSICAPTGLAEGGAERHLKNVRQLTFGRQNAEAYFSFDGTKLIFQSTNNWMKDSFAATLKPAEEGLGCYQMYVMDLESSTIRLVSTGTGATTCGYFFPGDRRVLYSSTYASGPNCPPKPKRDGAYRWALDDYDIYAVRIDGQEMQRLTSTPGYDAEATVSPDGKTIVWTSVKDGDLDLYAMNLDGTKTRRLTEEIGYDGGAFFSPDGRRIIYRGSRTDDYRALQIYVMNADGSGKRQLTQGSGTSFAPSWNPDGHRIVYCSNSNAPADNRGNFDIYLLDVDAPPNSDGAAPLKLTDFTGFDGFPVFSPDGRRLAFASNRDGASIYQTSIFISDFVE